ncbi:DUF4105 domain-containing protein [Paludibacter sp.]
MKRIASLIILVTLFVSYSFAQSISYGDSIIVSLLTCEPGKELYSQFGHTAIRIKDTNGVDMVYNYGIFDFRAESFYWKFAKGKTDYMLGVYPTVHFIAEYTERNSNVWEQILNLNKLEKQRLIEMLNFNNLPENRIYRYNFIYDNCSTRPYEMINRSLLKVTSVYSPYEAESYRDMINDRIDDFPWSKAGINLLFGTDADRVVRNQTRVFLPDNLMDVFQSTKLICMTDTKNSIPLVSKTQLLVQATSKNEIYVNWLWHPFTISLIWLLIGLIIIALRHNIDALTNKVFDSALFFITGVGGVIIFFFMFFSEHPFTGKNLNILWMNPMNILLSFMVWKRSPRKFFFFYNIAYILMIALNFFVVIFLSHSIIYELVPLQILLFARILWREERLLHILFVPTDKGIKWR